MENLEEEMMVEEEVLLEEESEAAKPMDILGALPNMNILKPLPDNPVLQILTRTGAECLKALPKDMACRSCPNSLWMCQQDDLVCFCRATRYVIWQASRPKKNIVLLCSGRIGRSADGE
ncbi:MAG: hypothetical protein IKH16_07155 [Selenomonadaceae bacterium]|nr:hypothetical protein [Selenomonadaceae bacterium]